MFIRFSLVADSIIHRKDTTEADFGLSTSNTKNPTHHSDANSDSDADVDAEDSSPKTEAEGETVNDTMQTFVFSATLSKDLQRNLKKRAWKSWGGAGGKKGKEVASTLGTFSVVQSSTFPRCLASVLFLCSLDISRLTTHVYAIQTSSCKGLILEIRSRRSWI